MPPLGRRGCGWPRRYLAAGEIDVARRLSADLASTLPEAALGVLVCDLLSGRDSDLTLDIDDETAHRELRSWVDLLRGAAPPALLECFRRAAPAVTEFFSVVAAVSGGDRRRPARDAARALRAPPLSWTGGSGPGHLVDVNRPT